MTTFDEHRNLALGTVSTGSGVIDSASGTTLVAASDAEAAEFPAVPFFVTVWRDQTPIQPAVEIMRASAFDGARTFTVEREQQGTTAQAFISQGWKFGNTITVADIVAIEDAVTGGEAGLAAETAARESADATLQSNIGAEAAARVAGDAATLVSAEAYADTHDTTTLAAAETYADGKVAAEASSRVAGDAATLATAEGYTDGEVSSEAATRAAADSTLQGHIDAEATSRASGDAATLASSESYADGKVAAEAALRVTGDSTTLAAAEAYTDAKVVAGVHYRGAIDASTNPNLPAANLGDLYAISVAGTVSGVAVEAGDMALCKIDGTPGNTPANWDVVQTNINGAVTGPVSATDADFALFNGSSGKVLKDGGLSLDTDATLAADSDSRIASQRATRTYTDAEIASEAALRVAGDSATLASAEAYSDAALVAKTFASLADVRLLNLAAGDGVWYDASSGKFENLPGAFAFPEQFGAVGDGVTDDTVALLSWAASGKTLKLSSNKTYLHSQTLALNATGQRMYGAASAKLLRMAQAVTTSATPIVSGVTNAVVVAALSGGSGPGAWTLKVGDRIVVEQGGTFDQTSRAISAIDPNTKTVTITGTFGVSLAGPVNVRHGWNQVTLNGTDSGLFGVDVDGNSSHWSWGRWQHTGAVLTGLSDASTSGQFVVYCRVHDQYGDGLSPASPGAHLAHNTIQNIYGRGIVFGGLVNFFMGLQNVCAFNRLLNTNLDINVSGSDGQGAIDFSQGGQHTVIVHNYFDGGIDGIGGLRSFNNSKASIIDNDFRNMTRFAINGSGSGTQTAKDVLIAFNRFANCDLIIQNFNSVTDASIAARWRILGNEFVGASAFLQTITGVLFANNQMFPMLPPDTVIGTAQGSGGTFTAGTYFYKITALNSRGETVGSDEFNVVCVLHDSVILNWSPVSNAVNYKIYRATSSGGQTGANSLVATVAGAPGTYTQAMLSYLDTGAAASAGSVPATDTTMTTVDLIDLSTSAPPGDVATLVSILGNQFNGGLHAINANAAGIQNLLIATNFFVGQANSAIETNSGISGLSIKENVVVADARAIATYVGIYQRSGEVSGNRVILDGQSQINGGIGINVLVGSGLVCKNNRVTRTGTTSAQSIALQSSSSNCVVTDNTCDSKVSDGGTANTLEGNKYQATGARSGVATLAAGTVTVSTSEVDNSTPSTLRVKLTRLTPGAGHIGTLIVSAVGGFSNFTVQSVDSAGALVSDDTGVLHWEIVH